MKLFRAVVEVAIVFALPVLRAWCFITQRSPKCKNSTTKTEFASISPRLYTSCSQNARGLFNNMDLN